MQLWAMIIGGALSWAAAADTAAVATATVPEVPPPPISVAFPEDANTPSCSNGGSATIVGHADPAETPHDFAQRKLGEWFEGGSGDMLLVLGADTKTLWVLEVYVPVDACDSVDCGRVVLREVGFDGRRRAHDLGAALGDDDMTVADRISKRLEAWQILSGGEVQPVSYQVNQQQRLAGADGVSTWMLRVRDSVHRKSFVWRRHMGQEMCWCTTSYSQSTYDWTI